MVRRRIAMDRIRPLHVGAPFSRLFILVVILLNSFGLVSAHVVVGPSITVARSTELFTVSVPNERQVAVSRVKLVLPPGITDVVAQPPSGWQASLQTDSTGRATALIWSGGSVPVRGNTAFTFFARVPAQPTELDWKAYQTYADGTIVAWDRPEGTPVPVPATATSGPFSVTRVYATAQAAAAARSSRQLTPSDFSTGWWLLCIACLAILVALFDILLALRTKAKPHVRSYRTKRRRT